jgi:hypothetical protein
VETTRTGQDRLALPDVPRRKYATGVQEWCARCARHGIRKRGMPRVGGVDGEPLCLACWPGWRGRRAHLQARQAEQLDAQGWRPWELQALGLAAADDDADTGAEDTGVCCAACGQLEATPECWLCGWLWLQRVQRDYELEQAAAAAATEAEFFRIAAVAEVELRLSWLEGVLRRAQDAVEAYLTGGGKGRPVELLADLMAREAAARTTLRGRPGGTLHRVGAVMALDSDWRSGRRSMAGRAQTAELAGCSTRAVTGAWKAAVTVAWAERTREGRKLTLAERMELGRTNDRAEYDLAPVHLSPVDPAVRASWAPLALATFGDLIENILELISAVHDDLDGLRARVGAVPDPAEMVRRAQMRQAADRAMTAAVTAVDNAAAGPDIDRNFFPPRMASKGECFSSLSLGVKKPSGLSFHPQAADRGSRRPGGRRKVGASRSSTRRCTDLEASGPHVDLRFRRSGADGRPRTAQEECAAPRRARPRPEWTDWAPDLYVDLVELWPWLRRSPRPMVVATLGAVLGPEWTAQTLVDWVNEVRRRPLLDPDRPVSYLKALLREALTGDRQPPHPARMFTEHRQAAVVAEAEERRARQAAERAEAEQAAEAARASGEAGVSARDRIRATLAQATGHADRHRPLKPWSARRPGAAAPVDVAPPAAPPVVLQQCSVAWHGCSGEVSAYQEPWENGREVLYCEACAAVVIPSW